MKGLITIKKLCRMETLRVAANGRAKRRASKYKDVSGQAALQIYFY